MPRTLSERSRANLARALHAWNLTGLTGHDLSRTAARMRALVESDDPSALLRGWWGAPGFPVTNAGESLVRSAFAGDDEFVRYYLRHPRYVYLVSAESTREVVSSARRIAGMSIDDLANKAAVPVDIVRGIERGNLPTSVVAMKGVIEAVGLIANRFVVAPGEA